jgi:anti-sigma B factor antagonist
MTVTSSRHIQVERRQDALVIALLDNRITDSGHVHALHVWIQEATEPPQGGNANVVMIDFANVEYLSSSMLSVLVALQARLQRQGRRLVLAGLADTLRSIFRMTKLHRVFDIHDDAAEVIASLPRPLARGA